MCRHVCFTFLGQCCIDCSNEVDQQGLYFVQIKSASMQLHTHTHTTLHGRITVAQAQVFCHGRLGHPKFAKCKFQSHKRLRKSSLQELKNHVAKIEVPRVVPFTSVTMSRSAHMISHSKTNSSFTKCHIENCHPLQEPQWPNYTISLTWVLKLAHTKTATVYHDWTWSKSKQNSDVNNSTI